MKRISSGKTAGNCEDSRSSSTGAEKRQRLDEDGEECLAHCDPDISHINQPLLMSVYIDPVTEVEHLVIVATLLGGVTEAKFTLVGDGTGTRKARIEFDWPEPSVDIEGLFAQEIDSGEIPFCHPMIIAMKRDLKNCRENIEHYPKGFIDLDLPISVQTASESISISGKQNATIATKILIVRLKAFQDSYTVQEKQQKVVFTKMKWFMQ